jgi:TolB-like protein
MLAVMPFANLSGERQQDYFADGLTEELIAEVGRLQPEHLGVIARTSAMAYKQTEKSVAQVGRELGVEYLLEGSVRRERDRVRITAQLVEVNNQSHIWSRSYDRRFRDILKLQAQVAQDVAVAIHPELALDGSVDANRPRPAEPDAYEALLKLATSGAREPGEGWCGPGSTCARPRRSIRTTLPRGRISPA